MHGRYGVVHMIAGVWFMAPVKGGEHGDAGVAPESILLFARMGRKHLVKNVVNGVVLGFILVGSFILGGRR